MNKNSCRLLFLITFGLCFVAANGQHSAQFSEVNEQYPDAYMARLNEETTIRIYMEKDSLLISKDYLEENIYMNEAANSGSKESIRYSTFFEVSDLEASSFHFEKGKYRENEVTEFKEKDELNKSFHDDTRSINFIYPNLKKGSKTRLSYTEKIKNPRFLGSFYFGDFFPIIHTKVTLIVDEGIEMEFIEFNTDDITINFEKKKKRGKTIYSWEAKQIDEYPYESKIPSYSSVFPHIIPKITSYTKNGQQIELSKDVSHLYDWYYSLIKNVNTQQSTPELVSVVNEITSQHNTDLEKVKALYYWAQQNIKYIAFEYALGGFVPREANDVFKKKYGDCKDNSSILQEMMEIAGIEGQITWVGTRKIPYTYEEVPLPIVDNHMILTYVAGDDYYFLDATGRYTPFGFPTSFIQGKEALISNGANNFTLLKVPEVPAKKNTYKEVSHLKISGENLIGEAKASVTGYKKRNFFRDLETVEKESQLKEYYNAELRKGNNTFLIDRITEKNKFEYDLDFEMEFDYTIRNYTKALGDEVYINLNLNKPLLYFKIDEDRKNDIDFDFKDSYVYESVLEIPEGYEVDYLPQNSSISNDLLEFGVSYDQKGNFIHYKHQLSTHFLRLNPSQQQTFNNYIKQVESNYNEIVVLKKSQ